MKNISVPIQASVSVFDLAQYLTETDRSAVFRKPEEQKPALDNGSERQQNVGSRSVTEGKDEGVNI